MKYIAKKETPDFFISDTQELKEKIKNTSNKSDVWDKDYKNKKSLKEYILTNEQNGLCCYCESYNNLDNSHLEHIKPKSLDYDNLTFEYSNLIVSCNGDCHTETNELQTCGHRKKDKFDETKFLDSTKIENIRDYFIYTDNGYIGSSSLDEEKSKYMLKLLALNTFGNNLPQARLKALDEFRKSVQNNAMQTKKTRNEIAKKLLEKENLAFISFLKFHYKKLLSLSVAP